MLIETTNYRPFIQGACWLCSGAQARLPGRLCSGARPMGNMHECSGASMRLALMCRSKAQLWHMLAPEQPLCQTLCRSSNF